MRLVLLALLIPAAAAAQTGIDGSGVHAPGVRIDKSGVHTDHADVGPAGVRTHRGTGTTIEGNNGQRSVNCNGGALFVTGNGNNVSAAGCTRISVEGNGNTLLARFDRTGTVRLTGNRNHLAWSPPRDGHVSISDLGNGNSTARR